MIILGLISWNGFGNSQSFFLFMTKRNLTNCSKPADGALSVFVSAAAAADCCSHSAFSSLLYLSNNWTSIVYWEIIWKNGSNGKRQIASASANKCRGEYINPGKFKLCCSDLWVVRRVGAGSGKKEK
jgi:hypothetical protein